MCTSTQGRARPLSQAVHLEQAKKLLSNTPCRTAQPLISSGPNLSRKGATATVPPYLALNRSKGSEWVRFRPPRPATRNFSPTLGFCSYISTFTPALLRRCAAKRPEGPPPTIATLRGLLHSKPSGTEGIVGGDMFYRCSSGTNGATHPVSLGAEGATSKHRALGYARCPLVQSTGLGSSEWHIQRLIRRLALVKCRSRAVSVALPLFVTLCFVRC